MTMKGRSSMSFRNNKISLDRYLPSELWMDILARLPVKTLLKVRCISKSLRSIIDDPGFASLHLTVFAKTHYNNNLLLTVEEEEVKDMVVKLRHGDTLEEIDHICKQGQQRTLPLNNKVIGYNDGVVLVRKSEYELEFWNPSVRRSMQLPRCPVRVDAAGFNVGFGFDHSSKRVKVMAVNNLYWSSFSKVCTFFIMDNRIWRTKKMNLKGTWSFSRKPILCNRALHLLARDSDTINQATTQATHIVSMDLGNEKFTSIKLPDFDYQGDINYNMRRHFVFDGSIAILDVTHMHSCIWVMYKDTRHGGQVSWMRRWYSNSCLMSVNINFVFDRVFPLINFVYVEKTRKLFMVYLSRTKCYDFEGPLKEEKGKSFYPYLRYMGPYVESLVLLRL